MYAFRVFGGFSAVVAATLYLPIVAWMGLQFGLFAALLAWMGPLRLGLAAPLAFVSLEFLFPSLFPWRLANSQYRVPVLLQTGELAGPFLLSFAIVWANTGVLGLARIVTGRLRGRPEANASHALRTTVVPPLLLLAALLAFGSWRLNAVRAARSRAPVLRVGIVQGNVSIEHKSDRAFFRRNLDTYRAASRAVADAVDLLIWPETVVQHEIDVVYTRLTGDDDPLPGVSRALLFGGLALDRGPFTRRRVYNSAFLRGADGRVLGRYDKRILVPFGEYMPLGERFPSLRALSPATSNFSAGSEPAVLALDSRARVGALICYEDVIPAPARAAVGRGATLLVNLTNDAWYGDTAEPIQHQALAAWRAVETRRDLVRATNTGLTSLVGATGENLGELATFSVDTLVTEVRLLGGSTIYDAVGDLFAWGVVLTTLAAALGRRRKRAPRPAKRSSRAKARR